MSRSSKQGTLSERKLLRQLEQKTRFKPVPSRGGTHGPGIAVFTDTTDGLVPASGGGTVNYLRADGTFATPPGAAGGDNITVNTTAVTDANFNDTVPGAPAGDLNIKFQFDATPNPDGVSAYVDVSVLEPLLTLANLAGSIDLSGAKASGILAAARFNDTSHGNRGGGALHADVVAGGAAGFISGADKSKLDGISTGADNVTVLGISTLNPNFNDTTPAAPSAAFQNVKWQTNDPTNPAQVSAYTDLIIPSVVTSITAFAGGGQGSATQLAGLNSLQNITTCASNSDSVKLPTSAAGARVRVSNKGAANLAIFPKTGGQIDLEGVNAPITISPGSQAILTAIDASDNWVSTRGRLFSSAMPAALTATGGVGIAAYVARSDHQHPATDFSSWSVDSSGVGSVYGVLPDGALGLGAGTLFKTVVTSASAASSAAAQPWFPATGAVTVEGDSTYWVEGCLYVTNGATTHTTGINFTGTATISRFTIDTLFTSGAVNTQMPSNSAAAATSLYTSRLVWQGTTDMATNVVLNATSTLTGFVLSIKGLIRINAGGTLIPNFQWSANPTGTNNVLHGTWFKLQKIGTGSVVSKGTWA